MNRQATIDPISFRRILSRNVTMPLLVGVATATVFVGLVIYLLSALRWVEHSERVIAKANELSKLSVDLQTGLRGFLLTADESNLGTYKIARASVGLEMAALQELVGDNPVQFERLQRIKALQAQWGEYAQSMIAMRRQQVDFLARVRAGEGRQEFDQIRREFDAFLDAEQRLRQDRGEADVSVAAMYAADEDGTLRRSASYGFSAATAQGGQVFRPGEGLVGEAARARRLIQLDQLPPGYLHVTSGLGAGAPLHLVLAPVENEGKVNGVIELGFSRPVGARDLAFLRLLGVMVGVSLEAALYRQRLQEALEETQQLNEEMEVQQEELCTSNEELAEQSRVLEESQAHLERQKAALEVSNEQLAVQALALDQKNVAIGHAQLEVRAEELQRASRYKSAFLANMSHELRTPLNSSLILSKLLADNPGANLTPEFEKPAVERATWPRCWAAPSRCPARRARAAASP